MSQSSLRHKLRQIQILLTNSISTTMLPTLQNSNISAMCHQEENGYLCRHYLQYHFDGEIEGVYGERQQESIVTEECRAKMVRWCFSVVDFCECNRETVSIAISFLDRFLASAAGTEALQSYRIFQLAAMASLYSSIKIHEPEAISPNVFSQLSRGEYTVAQIESMEMTMLQATGWRVNPPTASAFVREFLELIPSKVMPDKQKRSALNLAQTQIEWALQDYTFVTTKTSTKALAALFNAIEILGMNSGGVALANYFTDLGSVFETQRALLRGVTTNVQASSPNRCSKSADQTQTASNSSPRSARSVAKAC